MSDPITALAAGGANLVGSLAGGAVRNSYNLKMWKRMNAYNHPRAQIERLKQAGLPPAAFFQTGNSGNTSAAPESQTDPNLGAAAAIEAFQMTKMRKQQIELQEQQIELMKEQENKTRNESLGILANVDVLNTNREKTLKEIEELDGRLGWQERTLEIEYKQKMAQTIGQEIQNDITRITKKYTGARQRAELFKLWDESKLLNQQFRDKQMELKARNSFVNSLMDSKGNMSATNALIYRLLWEGGDMVGRGAGLLMYADKFRNMKLDYRDLLGVPGALDKIGVRPPRYLDGYVWGDTIASGIKRLKGGWNRFWKKERQILRSKMK